MTVTTTPPDGCRCGHIRARHTATFACSVPGCGCAGFRPEGSGSEPAYAEDGVRRGILTRIDAEFNRLRAENARLRIALDIQATVSSPNPVLATENTALEAKNRTLLTQNQKLICVLADIARQAIAGTPGPALGRIARETLEGMP